MKTLKKGDRIKWSFDDSLDTPEVFRSKTYEAEIIIIDYIDKYYGVYAKYGQDHIPFNNATLIN